MKNNGWPSACALLAAGLLPLLLPSAAASSDPSAAGNRPGLPPASSPLQDTTGVPSAASPLQDTTGLPTPVTAAAPATAAPVPLAPRPPAQYTATGRFSGGAATASATLTGVRFGEVEGGKRMVLDFGSAKLHPGYSVEIKEFPYRLVARFQGLTLAEQPQVQTKGALPFSLVSTPDGQIKELQVFLPGPGEYKVIEVDDPAKLAIDIRRIKAEAPTIYAVQLTAPQTAAEAFALVEGGTFPAGFKPEVLVIGQLVVVEQAFSEAAHAAEMDAALQKMGYACSINERAGGELPSR